ncbi:hypothetical protein [Massilia sp. TSP1-1-2]|uniref:hypothetical protein n=1 Tax=unclassified Massilia TaxID=2609279 RepID=UPI003CF366BB
MKKSYLCTALGLACALGLAACGGSGQGELQISMGLSGVTRDGLKISNMGRPAVAVPPGALYIFPDLVPIDSDYDIVIIDRPPNVDSCTVLNGKGNTGAVSPGRIFIGCVVTTFPLGGTVKGLTGELIINNGSQKVTIPAGATTFSMTAPTVDNPKFGQVAEGTPYGLTVLQQPPGSTCTIDKSAGTMPKAAVNDIAISCKPN